MAQDDASPPPAPRPGRAAPAQTESIGTVVRGMFKRDMERNEQLVGFVGSVLAIGLGIAIAVAPRHPTFHGIDQVPWARVAQPLLASGVLIGITSGFAVALWLASRNGSRVLTAVVAMAGALFALSGIFGFPYIAYAGWLLIRNSRTVREQRASRVGTGPGGRPSPASSRTPDREPGARRRRREEPATPATLRPDASKRYTPPRDQRRGRR